jgi:hypothetical protein
MATIGSARQNPAIVYPCPDCVGAHREELSDLADTQVAHMIFKYRYFIDLCYQNLFNPRIKDIILNKFIFFLFRNCFSS